MATSQILHSIPEAAGMLSISRAKLYELISEKKIRVIKIGTRTVVAATELHRFVNDRMTEAA